MYLWKQPSHARCVVVKFPVLSQTGRGKQSKIHSRNVRTKKEKRRKRKRSTCLARQDHPLWQSWDMEMKQWIFVHDRSARNVRKNPKNFKNKVSSAGKHQIQQLTWLHYLWSSACRQLVNKLPQTRLIHRNGKQIHSFHHFIIMRRIQSVLQFWKPSIWIITSHIFHQ